MEVTIGKHTYELEPLLVKEQMKAISLYRGWTSKYGMDIGNSSELATFTRTIAGYAFMVKKIDGKEPISPEENFKMLLNLTEKERLSFWALAGQLNEGTDFLALMNLINGNKNDSSSSANDLADSQ